MPLLCLLHLPHRNFQGSSQELQVLLQTLFYQVLVVEDKLPVLVDAPTLKGLPALSLELSFHLPYPLDVLSLVEQLDNRLIFEASGLVEFHADFTQDL